jgi:hypothetical protein
MVSNENSTVSKIVGSGQNATLDPVSLVGSPFCSGPGLELA